MTFFNKKEDVLKIELTPYGRKILGQGKFKPMYYTFLDDDILYNSSKANFAEDSIKVKDRILKETIYMKPQTNYKGVETSINSTRPLRENTNDDNIIPERFEKLQYQIGTNNYNTTRNAEISATFFLGEISGSVPTQYTGSNIATTDIPQINCDLEYNLSVQQRNQPKTNQYGRIPEDFITFDFKSDGSYVHIEKGEILIFLNEEGGFPEKENFSIEIFEYLENESSLKPLKFNKKNRNIVDGIYYENYELPDNEQDPLEDYVEYHMELLVDDEIAQDKLCDGIKNLKKENIYVDIEVDCDDIESGLNIDLYQGIVSPDDLENC